MKKHIFLPLLTLTAGVAGLVVHRWELAATWDEQLGLFLSGHPATLALCAMSVVATVVLAALARGGQQDADWREMLQCPSPVYMGTLVCAAVAVLLSEGFGLLEFGQHLNAWQMDSSRHMFPLMQAMCCILAILAAASVVMFGRGVYRGTLTDRDRWAVTIPAYMGAF